MAGSVRSEVDANFLILDWVNVPGALVISKHIRNIERDNMKNRSNKNVRSAVVQLFLAIAVSIMGANAFAHEYEAGAIVIDHPWARPSRVATIPAAVYFDIINNGSQHDRLIAATTTRAEHVELHQSEMTETGATRMRHLKEGIDVPAGIQTSMETGAYHVMLIGFDTALTVGESFPMTLTFETAGSLEVIIHVEDRETKSSEHHMQH